MVKWGAGRRVKLGCRVDVSWVKLCGTMYCVVKMLLRAAQSLMRFELVTLLLESCMLYAFTSSNHRVGQVMGEEDG